jgi:hypothetical protein
MSGPTSDRIGVRMRGLRDAALTSHASHPTRGRSGATRHVAAWAHDATMNPDTTHSLREQALGLLATIDDAHQPHEVRVVASSALGWSLHYLRDNEGLLTAILAVVRRAIDRGDRSPLVLVHDIGEAIHRNEQLAEAVARLGEHALERGNAFAIARVTIALVRRRGNLVHAGKFPGPLRAPARWVRALVGSTPADQLEGTVRDAVRWWLDDEENDLAAVRDIIPDPSVWGNLDEAASTNGETPP